MRKLLLNIFRINPSTFSFISGLVVSLPANLITGLAMDEGQDIKMPIFVFSSVLLIIGAVFWSGLSWKLESITRLTLLGAPSFVESDKAWNILIIEQIKLLSLLFLSASIFTVTGMVVMFL